MKRVRIVSDVLSAEIAADGAELSTLQDAAGRHLLWDGDARWWTGRAPLLFPIVGRLPGDRARIDGREYELLQHGFARTSTFTCTHADSGSCRFELRETAESLQRYPRAFHLAVTYAIDGPTLSILARVTNTDARPLPFSFGFHPAFRWPLAGDAREGHVLEFERDEPAPIRRPHDGLLAPGGESLPVDGRRLALHDGLFEAGALVFDTLQSRRVRYVGPHCPQIEVGFPHMQHLGVWTKPGAPFVCIEPWHGYAAPVGFAGELREKPGIIELTPGDISEFGMTVTLRA